MAATVTPFTGLRIRAITVAAVIGAVLGLSASLALATHIHTYALWNHGLGDPEANAYVHPFNASTDGAGRDSEISYGIQGTHGPITYRVTNHNHLDVYTGSVPERDTSSHNKSDQTGLDHHHHFF